MRTFLALSLLLAAASALPRSTKLNSQVRYPHLVMSKEFGLEKRYSARGSRIHDGQPAELGQFPFAVHVQMPIGGGASYVCTGSLISPDVVVTAAHCVADAVESFGISVQYGVLDYTNPGPNEQTGLSDYAYNSDFTFNNRDPITSDIGYVKLDRPIDDVENVGVIAIAEADPVEGEIATEAGWGATEAFGSASRTLNWVTSNVVSDQTAYDLYGQDSYVAEEFFCTDSWAFTDHGGACGGDSGGPATNTPEDGTPPILWGATSFASSNCEIGYSCYTSVVYFRSWLTENTGQDFGP